MKLTLAIDYAIVPAFLVGGVVATALLLYAGLAPLIVSEVVVGVLAGIAALLERFRPERADYRTLDQPFRTELAHFAFNYNLGYALALAACGALAAALTRLPGSPWPTNWPTGLQIVAAVVLAEAISYWQHRAAHRIDVWWRFHALHHRGSRLNLVRAGRFHFVDIGVGAFMTFAPLVLLRAPDSIVAYTVVISGALGVLQHANLRARTPRWLDRVLCTPAVHRLHHSVDARDLDTNFGTLIMTFDQLFGTYAQPTAPGPAVVGVEHDALRAGFIEQLLTPFRSSASEQRGAAER